MSGLLTSVLSSQFSVLSKTNISRNPDWELRTRNRELLLPTTVLQRPEQCGALCERQRLGPDGRLHAALRQSCAQRLLIVLRLEIIPERLALLSEREPEERNELGFGNPQGVEARLDRQANHTGVNFRRWRKRARRKREQFLDARIQLGGHRKQAIVAASRRCRQSVRYFLLHHDDNRRKVTVIFEQAQQDVRGDVVGKIADDVSRLGSKVEAGTKGTGLRSENGVELDLEDVPFDDFHVGISGELHAKLRGQHAIKFDSDDPPSARGQQRSQRAAAWADLKHRGVGEIAQSFDNSQSCGLTDQKVLSQFGLAAFLGDGPLSHVDPLSFRHLDWQGSSCVRPS